MALKRFSYPCRYSDMIPRFAKPVPVLSMITNTVVDFIYDMQGHRIMLEQYAAAVAEKVAALDNCYGFIDGTNLKITKGLSTMGTKEYTQSRSSLSLYHLE